VSSIYGETHISLYHQSNIEIKYSFGVVAGDEDFIDHSQGIIVDYFVSPRNGIF
jgi:hypothetical protein